MEKVFTKIYPVFIILLIMAMYLPANAQYTKRVHAENIGASAMCKDASGNVYVLRSTSAFQNTVAGIAEVVRYNNNAAQDSTVLNSNLGPNEGTDGGYESGTGIAVDSQGNVYVSTGFNGGSNFGNILKLKASTGYSSSTFYAGTSSVYAYFGGLAIDSHDNLYVTAYDWNGNGGAGTYDLLELPGVGSLSSFGGSPIQINTHIGDVEQAKYAGGFGGAYTPYSAIAIDASDNIFLAAAYGYSGSTGVDGGNFYKFANTGNGTFAAPVTLKTDFYCSSLGVDPTGNLYAVVLSNAPNDVLSAKLVNYGNSTTGTNSGALGAGTTISTALAQGVEVLCWGIAAVSSTNIYVINGEVANSGKQGDIYQFFGVPATQASGISFTNTNEKSTTINWTVGDGSSRAVFVEAGNSGSPSISNGVAYGASATFGSGSTAGPGWYSVYNGTGTSVTISNLTANTTYRAMVVEYNGGTAVQNYLTSAGTNNPNNVTTATNPVLTASGSAPSYSTGGSAVAIDGGITVTGGFGTITSATVNVSTAFSAGDALNFVNQNGISGSYNSGSGVLSLSGSATAANYQAALQSITFSSSASSSATRAVSFQVGDGIANSNTVTKNVTVQVATTLTSLAATTPGNATPTNAASVQYTATFAASVTGLSASNFSVTQGGSVTGASVTGVSGSGTSWTVTVNTGSGDGTVQLVMANATGVTPSVSNVPFNGDTYTIDKTLPTVVITRSDPNPIHDNVLDFQAVFSEPVTGVTGSSFVMTNSGVTTGAISATQIDATHVNITVATVAGTGTARLDLVAGGATDAAGNQAAAFNGGTDATYDVDQTAPTVNSITATTPSNATPTNATSLVYTVTFSEAVTGVDASDFTRTTLSGNATGSISSISGSGNTYQVTLTGVGGNGTLRMDLNASGTGIQDAAGNPISGGFTTGDIYTIDNTPATLTSGSYFSNNGNSSQYAKVGDNITLSIGYNEPLQSLAMTIGGNTISVTPSNGNRNWTGIYTETTSDAEGNVPWTLSAVDLAGNVRNYSNTDFGTFLVFDKTPPVPVISAPSQSTAYTGIGQTVTYNVTYNDANFNNSTLSTSDITLNTTGTANGTIGLSGSGTSYVVTISDITGTGTLGISVGAGTAQDIPGNIATASDPSATFTVAPPSHNALLTILTLNPGAMLTRVSGPDYADYTATVSNSTATVKVKPVTSESTATLTVNGVPSTPGAESAPVTLNADTTSIAVTVTAGDGITKKTYRVTVARAPSSNARLTVLTLNPGTALTKVNGPDYADYTASVSNSTSSVTVKPVTSDPGATLTVNGILSTSGAESAPVTLNADTTSIAVTVTANDGITKKTYRVTVMRALSNNARLTVLSISPGTMLTKVPGPDYADYTGNIYGQVSTVKVKPVTSDPGATLTINGTPSTPGELSSPITLNVDTTSIAVTVTAADGVTKNTYRIVLTHAPSNNALLTRLTLNPGATLTQVGGPDFADYTASVLNSTASVTVKPVTSDNGATVTVNGTSVVSGMESAPVTLNADTTSIAVTVMAADRVTKNNYVVLITKQAPPSNIIAYEQPKEAPIEPEAVTVHQNVSPNGDGSSDALQIDGITQYPDNKLQIMSRAGNLVYEVKGYDNTNKVFDGHSSDGKLQQPGTYFYSLEYKVGNQTKRKTGYIVLKY